MATSSIYELLPAFNERSRVIFMLLGLLSLTQEWIELLESEASASQPDAEHRSPSPAGEDPFDDSGRGFLYFLLGTISFSSNLHSTLESARQNGARQNEARQNGESSLPHARQNPTWEDIGELLR